MIESDEGSRVDPRVRRTRRRLEEAMLSLAAEQDIASITVRDITTRADVNRATFYLHYRDKDDLCARALDRLLDDLTAEDRAFIAARELLALSGIPVGLLAVFRHCDERPDLFRRLLSGSGSLGFVARFHSYVVSAFMQIWTDMGMVVEAGSPPPLLRASSAAASLHGIIWWWLAEAHDVPAEDAAAWAWDILRPLWVERASSST